jgi:hypothetical protein
MSSLNGGHDHHKISPKHQPTIKISTIAIANSQEKRLVMMDSFCRWRQWKSGPHRLAHLNSDS